MWGLECEWNVRIAVVFSYRSLTPGVTNAGSRDRIETMKEIPLSREKVAIVDDADYEELSRYRWTCTIHGYARRGRKISEGLGDGKVYMHRQIARCLEHEIVDHINGNRLDNRRENLRTCTSAENVLNAKVNKNNKLGVKGVSKSMGLFAARVFHKGEMKFFKRFKTVEEAKAAYDFHAKIHHGEFSRS